KPNEILKTLREAKDSGKRFVWLARRLDEDTAQKINETLEDRDLKKYDLPRFAGLHWKEEQKRSYPYKSLAAHIVGFSNNDDIGQAGIEQSQEELLHGAVIRSWQDRDRLGRVYEEEQVEREPPKDIVLTISNSIQYKTEEALAQGVKEANAKSGMAVVLDPKTGEILAMANYPTFDPSKFNEIDPEVLTNKAIHSLYAPGSTFKLITYGSALDRNLISPTAQIDCSSGFVEAGKRIFRDSHPIGRVSYSKALASSSNVGAIKTAMKVGKQDFHGYVKKFGFGQLTGIELPAETRGILRPVDKWYGDSLASMSIGYEIGVTALQMASAYATIANNGVRIQPHIIKEIRQADGKIISTTQPAREQVVSPEAARNLRGMLGEVVTAGTGKRAQLDGYTSAGKTGTAWKFNPKTKRQDAGKYVSSFIGFAPADNPSVVIAVVMDEPKTGSRNGGVVAAPVFSEIAAQILPELNVIPDANIRQDSLLAEEIPEIVEEDAFFIDRTEEETEENLTDRKAEKSQIAEKKPIEKPKEIKVKVKEKDSDKKKDVPKPKAAAVKEKPKDKPREKEKT
ncbi:MAG TPA: penicillin-binding protein 2, partial [Pyrinomonadaceae bacterium]|nr:penicillin-binding protein 2 [Pyrinomonadaceae bacterium]